MKWKKETRPTERQPRVLDDEQRTALTPLRIWQVIRQDPDGRTVDYGLFASEESAKALRERLLKSYPEDEDRLIVTVRTVRS